MVYEVARQRLNYYFFLNLANTLHIRSKQNENKFFMSKQNENKFFFILTIFNWVRKNSVIIELNTKCFELTGLPKCTSIHFSSFK